jgi:hypothetical protein
MKIRSNQPRKTKHTSILIISLIIIQTGCATAYQPVGLTGGFMETKLSQDVWEVKFDGNGFTSEPRARDLTLLRSAELTLNNSFSYFVIANAATDKFSGTNAGSVLAGGVAGFIPKPFSTNTVRMFASKPDVPANVIAYDAKFVCNSIGIKYNVTCNSAR